MNKKKALTIYNETQDKLRAYNLVLSTTYFDRLTVAPKAGSEYRNKMLAYMDGEYYLIATNKDYIDAVLFLSKQDLKNPLKREIELAKKSLEKQLCFTKDEQMSFSLLQMNGNDAWQKAKKTNNYKLFEKHLKNLYEVSIQRAKKRNSKKMPYEVYLDDYEEGMTIKDYDKFFNLIKKELSPLIKKINKKQDLIDDSFLYKY